jgi:hypothetical protein
MRMPITIIFVLISLHLFSLGIIKGKVSDLKGEPIPYATIFVKEISLGTTSNSNGNYEIPLAPGSYHIQYRSMGFVPNEIVMKIDSMINIEDVILPEQVFQFQEVKIYVRKEDRAYPIMRRAISMAPYYLNQVKKYTADVYLKGTVKLEKVPNILKKNLKVGINDAILKVGDLFVGESFSEMEFEAPNIYKQKIISSNMSMMDGQSQIFDMGLITNSVYSPEIDNLIMPLSPRAFSYYDFKFIGSSMDGKYLINKIEVAPKRKSKQLFTGFIYVVDGLWCLNSLELENDQVFGKVTAKIQMGEIKNQVWMPLCHNISVDGGMMGIKGKANYTSSVKYKLISMNESLKVPSLLTDFITEQKEEEEFATEEKSKRQQKIEMIMNKEELTNRDAIKLARLLDLEAKELQSDTLGKKSLEIQETYQVEKDDSATLRPIEYWSEIRPNPLTTEEHGSYLLNDSLVKLKSVKKDTIEKKSLGKIVVGSVLSGHQFKWHGDSISLKYKGLINLGLLSFNPAEGWRYGQELEFNAKLSNQRFLNSTAWIGYAFNRKLIQWNLDTRYQYSPLHPGYFNISLGSNVVDYMGADGINPFVNSVASLFFKENYARYIQQKYIQFENIKEIANGLDLKVEFACYNRNTLQNVTNYSFFSRQKIYHPNAITLFDGTTPDSDDENSSVLSLGFRYIPRQHYRIKDGRKIPEWSNWPMFAVNYKKGINNLFGSDADWDYLELKINQEIKTGVNSNFIYEIRGGLFFNTQNLAAADFASFKTSPSPVSIGNYVNTFHLLPYYSYNTNNRFIEAHCVYSSPNIFLKYLPWFSEQVWNENLHLSYLSMPGFRNYAEAGYFLNNVFLIGDIGVYAGFENGKYTRTGIKVAFSFK